MKKTIGFFGDSFCAKETKFWSNYKTYISMLSHHYNAKIVNLGCDGSSISDTIIHQFMPFFKNNTVPDICVFVWTDPARLFHRTIRNINYASVKECSSKNPIWTAAKNYYEHLYDHEFSEFEYTALLSYFDNTVLSSLPKNIKIIHLWSFGNPTEWNVKGFSPENVSYYYNWKTGVEIRPPLITVSLSTSTTSTLEDFNNDWGPNHLSSKEKNETVFNWIKTAIDEQSQEIQS
jgi:hypothetical protein